VNRDGTGVADQPTKAPASEKGQFIVERRYVADERIHEPEQLEVGGIDISGRWGVLIEPRTISQFDHSLFRQVQREPTGTHMHRCFQCGNCTAVCPVAEEHPEFNPRYYIHAVRMGYAFELEAIRRHVYLCESCGRCSEVCPRQVDPSGVMMAIGTVVRKRM
jgi:heterodisulfide reductase subunit C